MKVGDRARFRDRSHCVAKCLQDPGDTVVIVEKHNMTGWWVFQAADGWQAVVEECELWVLKK